MATNLCGIICLRFCSMVDLYYLDLLLQIILKKRVSKLFFFIKKEFFFVKSGYLYSDAYATANIVHSGFLKRGNYLKIRNVTLSYTLPKSIMKKNSLTLSASCNNLLTLSTLWGADPEASTSRSVAGCIDRDSLRYPNQRGYVFQANFTF